MLERFVKDYSRARRDSNPASKSISEAKRRALLWRGGGGEGGRLVAEGWGERRQDVGEVAAAVQDRVRAVLPVPVALTEARAVDAAAVAAAVGGAVAEADGRTERRRGVGQHGGLGGRRRAGAVDEEGGAGSDQDGVVEVDAVDLDRVDAVWEFGQDQMNTAVTLSIKRRRGKVGGRGSIYEQLDVSLSWWVEVCSCESGQNP